MRWVGSHLIQLISSNSSHTTHLIHLISSTAGKLVRKTVIVNLLIMMRWFMCTYMLCNALGIWIILKNRFLGIPFTIFIFFKFNFNILNRITKTQRKPREPILTRHERSLVVGPQKTFLARNSTNFWNFEFFLSFLLKVICFHYSCWVLTKFKNLEALES